MKIRQQRFSVPDCIWDDPMDSKARLLLMFLFRESDIKGCAGPGYAAMAAAIAEPGHNGSRSTVRKHLLWLQARGWIWHMKRTNARMWIWLRIPAHLRVWEKPKSAISVVQPVDIRLSI